MKASIDIGTNTALLLIADVNDGKLEVLHEDQLVPRLGKDVDKNTRLSNESIDRVIASLRKYQDQIAQFPDVDSITVTATSAVRDAQNRDKFLETVSQQTGLEVQVLSGVEEANYTFLGALSVLDGLADSSKVVIDIGGGSTEIACGILKVQDRYSYNMGCVRFTERFLQSELPTYQQIEDCREAIQQILKEYEFTFTNKPMLIGVAGTVTSLAYMDLKLSEYKAEALTGHTMSIDIIKNHIQSIRGWPSEKLLEKYPIVMEGRADIFLAGLLILEGFMEQYGFQQVTTSTGGIRHGSLLQQK